MACISIYSKREEIQGIEYKWTMWGTRRFFWGSDWRCWLPKWAAGLFRATLGALKSACLGLGVRFQGLGDTEGKDHGLIGAHAFNLGIQVLFTSNRVRKPLLDLNVSVHAVLIPPFCICPALVSDKSYPSSMLAGHFAALPILATLILNPKG